MLLFSEENTCNLSFRPFFCFGYAMCANAERQNHMKTHARAKFFPYREDCGVIFLTAVEPRGAFQPMRGLRSAPVIAHNMAVLVSGKDI
jgi:hypothetical protein